MGGFIVQAADSDGTSGAIEGASQQAAYLQPVYVAFALISKACDEAGISYQYLDGQTTPAQRQQRVEAFQNGEGDAFLISLKAGGTGLNLTAADYVIHMDPWWNPAVEDQATDRTHRIGQTKPVMVYRIIARGTIEEQILALHEEKRDLVDGVLAGADAAARLSTKELAELIRQGPEATVAKLAGAV
ncbi:MAG UNVERIFIED_CONTAM: SWF/SNF helicase family protein [Planctomycetaceae bacterium]